MRLETLLKRMFPSDRPAISPAVMNIGRRAEASPPIAPVTASIRYFVAQLTASPMSVPSMPSVIYMIIAPKYFRTYTLSHLASAIMSETVLLLNTERNLVNNLIFPHKLCPAFRDIERFERGVVSMTIVSDKLD